MLKIVTLVLVVMLSLSACASMTPSEQDTVRRGGTGTVVGAAGGAAIGAMAGNAGMGAAIGAGVGLLGGIIYDQNQKAYDRGKAEGQAAR
jgi:uncharacterized membrane protein